MRRAEAIHEFTEWPMERCERQSAKVERLVESMKRGVVTFRYVKLDGTIRTATGTLMPESFDRMPKGVRPVPVSNIPYWDLERGSFRSFNAWALL